MGLCVPRMNCLKPHMIGTECRQIILNLTRLGLSVETLKPHTIGAECRNYRKPMRLRLSLETVI